MRPDEQYGWKYSSPLQRKGQGKLQNNITFTKYPEMLNSLKVNLIGNIWYINKADYK